MRWRIITTAALALSVSLGAQTRITPPDNKYTPAQDVKLGLEAAQEARQQLPILRDDAVSSYLEDVGHRLVSAVPAEFRHSEFRYTFEPVNVKEINAFALPGGPMFVNRGMMQAAKTEGEVAGVMAHELSHVVLRHGTAQASKATKYQIGEIIGAVAGAIIGGRAGSAVAQGTQFGVGVAFLRFGREYEKQADILGAQIMARAGYDPRDMANMFKTIEKQGGSGGPEWLSDHPNPGNRSAYITEEAQMLRVSNPVRDTQAFTRIQSHLRSMSPAPSTEDATRRTRRTTSSSPGGSAPPSGRVDRPSAQFVDYNEGDVFRVSVPANWRELSDGSNAVTFAPDGAYGSQNGQSIFTHGVELGIARNANRDLQTATDALIDSLAQGNPRLSRPSGYRRTSLGGRGALQTTLGNISDATGRNETIQIVTTEMRDGYLFYAIAVAPQEEVNAYQPAFRKVVSSIRFMN